MTTTVALVEDNDTMRQTLRELIDTAPGHRCVYACATAKEALAEIPRHCPQVPLAALLERFSIPRPVMTGIC